MLLLLLLAPCNPILGRSDGAGAGPGQLGNRQLPTLSRQSPEPLQRFPERHLETSAAESVRAR